MKVKTLRSLFNLFVSLTLVVSLAPSFAWAADDSTGGGAVLTTTPQANSTLQKAPAKAPAATGVELTVGDGGDHATLAAAVAAASGGDTIKLVSDITETNVTISNKTLTIDLDSHTISAGGKNTAILSCTNASKVTVKNGTFADGLGRGINASASGANSANASLTISNCTFKNFSGAGSYAVDISGIQDVFISDSTFTSNVKVLKINNCPNSTIDNVKFTGNKAGATNGLGMIYVIGGIGGKTDNICTTVFNDCEFIENEIIAERQSFPYLIQTRSGASADKGSYDVFKFNNCVVKNNKAIESVTTNTAGYVLYFMGTVSGQVAYITMENTIVANNEALSATMRVDKSVGLTLKDSVVKDNTVHGKASIPSSAGGIDFFGKKLAIEGQSAVYDNKLETPWSGAAGVANDVYIHTYNNNNGAGSFETIPASAMKDTTDPDFDFSNMVWKDGKTTKHEDQPGACDDTDYYYTVMDRNSITVAKIGDTEFETLEDAFDEAAPGDVIEIVAQSQIVEVAASIPVDKAVTLALNDHNLELAEDAGDTIFTVGSGASLTFTNTQSTAANNKVDGGIAKGKLVIEDGGSVVVSDPMLTDGVEQGGNLTLNAVQKEMNVTLGKDKVIALGEAYNEATLDDGIINVTLDSTVQDNLNQGTAAGPVTIATGGNEQLVRAFKVNGITPNVFKTYESDSIVLTSGKAVYISSTGDDSAAGTSSGTPIKTYAEALSRIQNDPSITTVVVCGTVIVDNDQTWDFPEGVTVKRDTGFKKALVQVKDGGNLTLQSVDMSGERYQGVGAEEALIKVEKGGALAIEDGTTLRDNDNTLGSAQRYGGAVYSKGATTMTGGTIERCETGLGGGICQEGGTFAFTGGTIANNAATTSRYLNQQDRPGAGGGVMLISGAQMTMSASDDSTPVISNNYARGEGGGIALGAVYGNRDWYVDSSDTNLGTQLTMLGGLIDSNRAGSSGGGIYIQDSMKAHITGGAITNNTAENTSRNAYFAGGGIYVNGLHSVDNNKYETPDATTQSAERGLEHGFLYLENVEITGNTAQRLGGALAACNVSKTIIGDLTTAIHDNTSVNDNDKTVPTHSRESSGNPVDVFLSTISMGGYDGTKHPLGYISNYMIAGGEYDWQLSRDGSLALTDDDAGKGLYANGVSTRVFTSATEEDPDVAAAIAGRKVLISGNYSASNGGGLGSDGIIVLGSIVEKVDVSVAKQWVSELDKEIRPTSLKFNLYRAAGQDGEKELYKTQIVEADENGAIAYTWESLLKYVPDTNNQTEYVYTVEEDLSYEAKDANGNTVDLQALYSNTVSSTQDGKRKIERPQNDGTTAISDQTVKNFTATNTLKTGELEVSKTVTGNGADASKAFSFTVTLNTKALNNIKINGTFGDMTFADNEATFTLKGGESKTAKDLPAGVTYTVAEEDYSADGYTTTKTGDTGTIEADKTASATFTNYNPGTAAGKLEVEKLLKGDASILAAADLPEFTFELVPDDASNPMPKQATVSIKGADFVDGLGTASFDEITFAKAGTYTYTLSEQEPSPLPAGWTYNTEKQKYTVVYVVTDTGTGLSTTRTITNVTGKQVNKAVFENDFKVTPTTGTISVEKTVSAGAPDTEFVFRVNPQNGAPEPAGGSECRITGAGSVDFGEITFTQPGEYTYEVEEVATNKAGWTYDTTKYTVTYTVSLNSDAQLVAQRTISKGGEASGSVEAITFANTYEQKDGTADGIEVQKKLGASVQPTEKQSFEFLITAKTEGAPMPEATTVSVEGEGTAAFGTIEFSKPGTYTYTVTEVQPNPVPEGYTYDTAEFTVNYTVEDRDAKLVVTKTEITKAGEVASGVEFTNTFAAGPVEESIEVKKIVSGNPDEDETFTFEIEAEEGTTVLPDALQVQVKGAGTASFGPLNFTTTGKFAYIVRELPGANTAYTYDATAYRVEFNVEEQDGKLVATRSTTQTDEAAGGALAFTNTYTPEEPEPEYTPSVPVEVVMIKHLKDALIHEEEFSFGLYNEDGQQQGEAIHTTLGIKTNPQADFYTSYVEIKFAGLSYTEPGVYNYTIREHVDGTTQVVEGDEWNQAGFEPGFYKGGVKYDDKEYPVVVTVVPTANGQLEASVAYPTADGDVHELVNEYNEDYIEIDEFDSHPNDGLHEPEPEETDKPTPPADTTKKDSPKTPTTKPSPKTGSVRTGDTNPVAPLSLLALVAAATAGFAFARRRNAKGTGHLA